LIVTNSQYRVLGLIKGEFVSDFTCVPTHLSDINKINLIGRSTLKNAVSINEIEYDTKVCYQKFDFLENVEVFPLENQLFPLDKAKRFILKNVILTCPKIDDSFHDSNLLKGRLKGLLQGTIVEVINLEQNNEIKTKNEESVIENTVSPNEETVIESTVSPNEETVIERTISTNVSKSSKNIGCGDNYLNSISSGNLFSGNGCASGSSGCQGGGCFNGCLPIFNCSIFEIFVKIIMAALAILCLLALLNTCIDSNKKTNSDDSRNSDDIFPLDTLRVYEIDSVERIIVDTVYTIDTMNFFDTLYISSKALPLPNVLFKTNSAVIRYSSLEGISVLGDSLKANERINLIIAGHTDDDGSSGHNDTLAFCRAKAVKDYLIDSCEISYQRIKIESYGERCPIEDNLSIEGRTTNRRVEFRYFGTTSTCSVPEIVLNENACELDDFKVSFELRNNVSFEKNDNTNFGLNLSLPFFTLKENFSFGNIRISNSNDTRVLYRVFKGDQFQLLKSVGLYSKVSFKGVEGYILTSKIKSLLTHE